MPPETDNLRLEDLYKADQKDREKIYNSAADVKELKHRDAMRRTLLIEMIANGEVNTSNDLYHGAVIFLHGVEPRDFLSAHRLATVASINGHRAARWLVASALDRFLMSVGLAQVYGTQFQHDLQENKYQLKLPVDDANLLEFEKRFLNVPAVADRLAQLNEKIQTK